MSNGNNLLDEENCKDQNISLKAKHNKNKSEEIMQYRILFSFCNKDIMSLELNNKFKASTVYMHLWMDFFFVLVKLTNMG